METLLKPNVENILYSMFKEQEDIDSYLPKVISCLKTITIKENYTDSNNDEIKITDADLNYENVITLLENGITPKNEKKCRKIFLKAVSQDNIKIVQLFLDNNIDLNKFYNDYETLFVEVLKLSQIINYSYITLLFQHGAIIPIECILKFPHIIVLLLNYAYKESIVKFNQHELFTIYCENIVNTETEENVISFPNQDEKNISRYNTIKEEINSTINKISKEYEKHNVAKIDISLKQFLRIFGYVDFQNQSNIKKSLFRRISSPKYIIDTIFLSSEKIDFNKILYKGHISVTSKSITQKSNEIVNFNFDTICPF